MDVKLGKGQFKDVANFYSNNFFRTAPINSTNVYPPVFSPTGGAFGPAQSVAMSSYTAGADIWYTTDGSTPSAGGGTSTLYSSAVSITVTTTLKAIAVKSGMTDSTVTSDTYTINGAVATPTFSPAAGSYGSTQSVTISTATSGASIYYTVDGSTPTTSSTPYTGAVSVSSSLTLKALATKTGYSNSAVGSATYTISASAASAPTFGTAAGTYDRAMTQSITLTTSSAGASIYYTTDGSTPTTSSTLYTGAISVDTTTTIKALASGGGFTDSSVSSATYTIVVPNLYIVGNGFNTGTSFVDSSGYAKTITVAGDSKFSTAQSLFNGSSGLFDGTGDSLSVASSADLGFGTSDFIISMSVRATTWSGGAFLYDQRTADPSVEPCIYYAGGGYLGYHVNGSDRITGSSLSTGTWYTIVVSRLSGITRMMVNGVQVGSDYTDSNNYSAAAITLFGRFNNTFNFSGHGSHIWVHKGTGISAAQALVWYNANVAFAPHPNLLLHMDGTNGGTTFTDSSNLAATVTNNGSATVSTTSPKFGTGSGSFDGSNYLSLGGQSAYAFGSADFTIEGWFNPTGSGGSADSLIGFGPTGVDGVYPSIIRVSGNLCYYTNVGTRITGGSLTTNTWQHIALVRKAGVTNLYLEGVAQGTQYADTNVYLNGATRPLINGYGLAPGTLGMIGKTDELQIINGAAKYTANFTPPTRAFVA